jgi:quinol monooxygenase YgiN
VKIVLVHVHVLADQLDAFIAVTIENARHSREEAGVARFDVIQHNEDPTRFILVEVYRDAAAAALHKETGHYKTWRAVVERMMAEPRVGVKYTNIYPNDSGWA